MRKFHATTMKEVVETPEKMNVKFASVQVAVVTVLIKTTSQMSADGSRREQQNRRIRTFVCSRT
ncbi:MAG TPA: hypothetical protein VIS99_05835 [Terrimicrobiaceae bacterium]